LGRGLCEEAEQHEVPAAVTADRLLVGPGARTLLTWYFPGRCTLTWSRRWFQSLGALSRLPWANPPGGAQRSDCCARAYPAWSRSPPPWSREGWALLSMAAVVTDPAGPSWLRGGSALGAMTDAWTCTRVPDSSKAAYAEQAVCQSPRRAPERVASRESRRGSDFTACSVQASTAESAEGGRNRPLCPGPRPIVSGVCQGMRNAWRDEGRHRCSSVMTRASPSHSILIH
jgi:hypothetical protein